MLDPILDGHGDPLLSADFSKGEQFWKFWTTPKVVLSSGDSVRVKVLSKRTQDRRFEFICFTETEDGTKIIWAEGHWDSDAELVAFVRGIQSMGTHMVDLEVIFEVLDFTTCDTYDRWNYKFREFTTIKLWSSQDGKSVRGNM